MIRTCRAVSLEMNLLSQPIHVENFWQECDSLRWEEEVLCETYRFLHEWTLYPTEVIKHYKVGFAHWLYSSEAVFVGTKLAEMFT